MPSPEEVHEFFAGLGIKHIPNLDKAIHRLAERTKSVVPRERCAHPRARPAPCRAI